MTIQQATQQLSARLTNLYEEREAGNIAGLVMENITGWNRTDRLLQRQHALQPHDVQLLEEYTARLMQHMPVQYVLGEAWFYGMKLVVDEHVLIPRPETEELVNWAVQNIRNSWPGGALKILDAGTGSGCIALALKKELPATEVFACDVSTEALQVAERNASLQKLTVEFLQNDFLLQQQLLPAVDILISNPPYIPLADMAAMHPNVLQYEPHLALFVPDNDPLVFYRAIASFAQIRLRPAGAVYAEIHEGMAGHLIQLFQAYGFGNTEIRKDLQGKDRMVKLAIS